MALDCEARRSSRSSASRASRTAALSSSSRRVSSSNRSLADVAAVSAAAATGLEEKADRLEQLKNQRRELQSWKGLSSKKIPLHSGEDQCIDQIVAARLACFSQHLRAIEQTRLQDDVASMAWGA